jgi:hypothetical protein
MCRVDRPAQPGAADRQALSLPATGGATPELAAAFSWLAALWTLKPDQADAYATEARKLALIPAIKEQSQEIASSTAIPGCLPRWAHPRDAGAVERGSGPRPSPSCATGKQFAHLAWGTHPKNINLLTLEGKPPRC